MKSVDLIAAGYEWTCPNCHKLNLEIEVTMTVKCRKTWKEAREKWANRGKEGCGSVFKTNAPEHAYG